MGRFDALNNLEENQKKISPPTVIPSPAPIIKPIVKSQLVTQSTKNEAKSVKKTTNPQVHKPTNNFPLVNPIEKIEKYTTHLEPSIVKKIKRYALEEDMKDYQVIKEALLLFFGKNK